MLIGKALNTDSVAAVADKFSCPTSTEDAAGWLEFFFDPASPGGLYHACNAGGCSWFEYGAFALDCAREAGLPLKAARIEPLLLAEMKAFVAPRPVHTVLSTEKLARTTGLQPRHWHEAVRDFIRSKYAPIPPAP